MEKIESLKDLLENSPKWEGPTDEELLQMAQYYGYEDMDVGSEYDPKLG